MDKKNVVSIYLYSGTMGPWDLHLAAQDFILQHFEQVGPTVHAFKNFVECTWILSIKCESIFLQVSLKYLAM